MTGTALRTVSDIWYLLDGSKAKLTKDPQAPDGLLIRVDISLSLSLSLCFLSIYILAEYEGQNGKL